MKKVLLWIAVPFAAIIGLFVGNALGKIIQYACLRYVLIEMDGFATCVSSIVGEATGGFCFVMAGATIAPSSGKTVSIILATINACLAISSIIYSLITRELTAMHIVNVMASALGAIYASINVVNKHKQI